MLYVLGWIGWDKQLTGLMSDAVVYAALNRMLRGRRVLSDSTKQQRFNHWTE